MLPKGIIFDLDDTIISFDGTAGKTWQKVCEEYSKKNSKINRFKLVKYFCNIQIEGEMGYGKPDIRLYQNALLAMKCKSKDAWSIGDNLLWEVKAPQELGIFSIWNDFRKRGLPDKSTIIPDKIVNGINEII